MAGRADAATSVDYYGSYNAMHRDDWLFRYTPGVGWSGEITGGQNVSDGNLWVRVDSDQFSLGDRVDLLGTFSVSLLSHRRASSGEDPAAIANFKHLTSSSISTYWSGRELGATGQGLASNTFSLTVPLQTIYTGSYEWLNITQLDHDIIFTPHGLEVFDPGSPAVLGIDTYAMVSFTGIQVVPEPASGLLLGLALIVRVLARRR